MDIMELARTVVGELKSKVGADYKEMLNPTEESKKRQQDMMMKMVMGATTSPVESAKSIYEKQATDLAMKAEDMLPKLVGKYDKNAMGDIDSLNKFVSAFAKRKETSDLLNKAREILKFRSLMK